MKKIITILLIAFFTNNLSAQDNKGNLLLEGSLLGSWTEIAISGNNIGYYITDNFALSTGYAIGLVESDLVNMNFGGRYHLSDNFLAYTDIYIFSEGVGPTYESTYSLDLGVKTRYYATKWMSIEPGVGLFVTDIGDTGTTFLITRLGFSLHFSKN